MNSRSKGRVIDWNEDVIAKDKLLYKGSSQLSDAELVSLIIDAASSQKSSLSMAKEVLELHQNRIAALASAPISVLKGGGGLSDRSAIRLMAAMELGRRLKFLPSQQITVIRNNNDVQNLLAPLLGSLSHEEFWVIYLNGTNRIIEHAQVSRGGTQSAGVDIKMILHKAITLLATSIIVAHNHPSGSMEVSKADIVFTNKLKEACKVVDINLLDHIIIVGDSSVSLKERGHIA